MQELNPIVKPGGRIWRFEREGREEGKRERTKRKGVDSGKWVTEVMSWGFRSGGSGCGDG